MKVTKDLRAYLDSGAPGWDDCGEGEGCCALGPHGLGCTLPEGHESEGVLIHVATGGGDELYAIWSV